MESGSFWPERPYTMQPHPGPPVDIGGEISPEDVGEMFFLIFIIVCN